MDTRSQSQILDQAFDDTPRVAFLPEGSQPYADMDEALVIGYGQTNSQPTVVRWMLEWLNPQPGDKVLDVGSGSGWTSALLARLVGPQGRVYAVERIPELVQFGQDNCERIGIDNVTFTQSGDMFGLPSESPFDRILVSASADSLPDELVDQLKPGGTMVIPVRNDILEIKKRPSGTVHTNTHSGFIFVSLLR